MKGLAGLRSLAEIISYHCPKTQGGVRPLRSAGEGGLELKLDLRMLKGQFLLQKSSTLTCVHIRRSKNHFWFYQPFLTVFNYPGPGLFVFLMPSRNLWLLFASVLASDWDHHQSTHRAWAMASGAVPFCILAEVQIGVWIITKTCNM